MFCFNVKKIGIMLLVVLMSLAFSVLTVYASDKKTDMGYRILLSELEEKILVDDKAADCIPRMEALNFSENEIENLSTAELLELCLINPFCITVGAYDSLADGYDFFSKYFTPAKALIAREDASDLLQKKLNDDLGICKKFFVKGALQKIVQSENEIIGLNTNMRATVYTPKGTPVYVFQRGEELTAEDKRNMNAEMQTLYPNATRLADPTTNYNCHSYAWYSHSTSNTYWMNDPSAYMSDTSYISVNSSYSGLTRVYYQGVHSAIRLAGNTKVRSKWGEYGLYSHNINYCPYSGAKSYWKFNNNITSN